MITIKPAPENRTKQLCHDNGITWTEHDFACEVGGAEQWVLFRLEKNTCTLELAQCEDMLLDGLVRACLNVADLRGVRSFEFSGRMLARWGDQLMSLGYRGGKDQIQQFFARESPSAR